MIDIILIALLAVVIGGAIAYIIRAKKNGAKCIGCPSSSSCHAKRNETKETHCCCCGEMSKGSKENGCSCCTNKQ